MPRLPPRLLAKAWKENPLLPLLVRSCRNLPSARRELQWLKEHAITSRQGSIGTEANWGPLLNRFCHDRSRGKPLQYILGSEYFGPCEITCRPGVLIPRQETAASVTYLTDRLGTDNRFRSLPQNLKVLDLCTGTGCISLLFARTLRFAEKSINHLDVLGVDISPVAVELAKQNQRSVQEQYHYQRVDYMDDSTDVFEVDCRRDALSNAKFLQADIFLDSEDPIQAIDLSMESRSNQSKKPPDVWTALHREGDGTKWDILISNPPYISPKHFYTTTTRSVRNFEPKLALVPPPVSPHLTDEQQGDLFYPRLLHLADKFQSRVLLMEVADLEQAERVSAMASESGNWNGVEIWCDEPGLQEEPQRKSSMREVPILGRGNGRSVFCWRYV